MYDVIQIREQIRNDLRTVEAMLELAARDRVLEQSGREAEKVESKPRHISEVIKTIV